MATIINFPDQKDRIIRQMEESVRRVWKEREDHTQEAEDQAVEVIKRAFTAFPPELMSMQVSISTEGWPALPDAQQQSIVDSVNRQLHEQIPQQLNTLYGNAIGAIIDVNADLLAALPVNKRPPP